VGACGGRCALLPRPRPPCACAVHARSASAASTAVSSGASATRRASACRRIRGRSTHRSILVMLFTARHVLTPLSVTNQICVWVTFVTVANCALSWIHSTVLSQVAGFFNVLCMLMRSPGQKTVAVAFLARCSVASGGLTACSIRVTRASCCATRSLRSLNSAVSCSMISSLSRNNVIISLWTTIR
jgi:hypothetical protein